MLQEEAVMRLIGTVSIVFVLTLTFALSGFAPTTIASPRAGRQADDGGPRPRDGQAIFRFDTFGDEQLWTDVLRMLVAALRAGQVDLTNPAVTTVLLGLNAVVGVQGKVNGSGRLTSVGITCALCHSSVDNSFAPGIGKRLDGWQFRLHLTAAQKADLVAFLKSL
jgi:hypothetical protein